MPHNRHIKNHQKELDELYPRALLQHYEQFGMEGIALFIKSREIAINKWEALSKSMTDAPVGHRVTILHDNGSDEWTLTNRYQSELDQPIK